MEVWKPIKGFEGLFEVSSYGNVRSLDKTDRRGHRHKGRVLSKNNVGSGYYAVVLCVDGISHRAYVHRLVAEAFIPNPEHKAEVNHKDGDKHNNGVSNLEWVTKSENGLHSFRVLKRKPTMGMLGKPSPNRKLTDEQVRAIRSDNRFQRIIAKEYGVEQTTISAIKRGIKYRNVV